MSMHAADETPGHLGPTAHPSSRARTRRCCARTHAHASVGSSGGMAPVVGVRTGVASRFYTDVRAHPSSRGASRRRALVCAAAGHAHARACGRRVFRWVCARRGTRRSVVGVRTGVASRFHMDVRAHPSSCGAFVVARSHVPLRCMRARCTRSLHSVVGTATLAGQNSRWARTVPERRVPCRGKCRQTPQGTVGYSGFWKTTRAVVANHVRVKLFTFTNNVHLNTVTCYRVTLFIYEYNLLQTSI